MTMKLTGQVAWTAFFLGSMFLPGCNRDTPKSATADKAPAQDTRTAPWASADGVSAEDILGRPEYQAISYGGYRAATRAVVPSVAELREDIRILHAAGIRILRTYNTQQFAHAANLLEAIQQQRAEDSSFRMYVMLGAWIDCEGAWSDQVNHDAGSVKNNTAEIDAAVRLANKYPEIVKIIAVGNEAMVHWAASYFVKPGVILKWVNHLQDLKKSGGLPSNIWITSSDNFASWGGDDASYHNDDLTALIKAVDYVSLHTYPFHDTHHNPHFWGAPPDESELRPVDRADAAMSRALSRAIAQYQATADYIASLGIEKPIHIGETGWATTDTKFYGETGSRAADEYKQKCFHDAVRKWTNEAGMSCFYFEAFDEQWKDTSRATGSENHFGLINLHGEAKYVLWDEVDAGTFEGLTRGGSPITKTFDGNEAALMASLLPLPGGNEPRTSTISTTNANRSPGRPVTESVYVVLHDEMDPGESDDMTYPSAPLKLNVWDGTCGMSFTNDRTVLITSGGGAWWGCGLEIQADGRGEDLTKFASGNLHFEIRGNCETPFNIGFQTGLYVGGTQVNNHVTFGGDSERQLTPEWTPWSIPITELDQGANLSDVTSMFFTLGEKGTDGATVEVRNIFYSRK